MGLHYLGICSKSLSASLVFHDLMGACYILVVHGHKFWGAALCITPCKQVMDCISYYVLANDEIITGRI